MPHSSMVTFWSRRSSLWLLAALGVILLLLTAAIALTFVVRSEAQRRSSHEVATMLALHDLRTSVLDAETGQRGYLLTREAGYLDPYWNALRQNRKARAEVTRLIGESPYHPPPAALARLNRVIDDKMRELDRTIELARSGRFADAVAIVRTDIGKRRMDAIRTEIELLGGAASDRNDEALDRFRKWRSLFTPLFALLIAANVLLVVYGVRAQHRRAAIEAEAAQASVLRSANKRSELLTRELNHRVKNLFSVVLAMVAISARQRPDCRAVADDLTSRIRALSLAHGASQAENAMEPVSLRDVLTRTLQPYAKEGDGRIVMAGEEMLLPVGQLTPVGLIIHELATNAVKYGALATDDGKIAVSWQRVDRDGRPHVALDWVESGAPGRPPISPPGSPGGFGSTMIDLCVKQLGGAMQREWPESGTVVRIGWPEIRD